MTFSAFCARCRKKVKKAERIIRYFDMFAGVGGFRAGLNFAGGFQCIGHCEIDKYADASYRAIHAPGKEEVYYPDARTIDPKELPDFDLLCGGFPCQAFSTAGRRKGFEDARGTLFFELARVVKEKRPAYLFLENVPGLLSHDRGRTFGVILSTLYDLGYHVEWTVLNSKHFGVPQSRRRLFLIGYLDPRCAGKILPVFGTDAKALVQIVHGRLGKRVYDSAGIACTPGRTAPLPTSKGKIPAFSTLRKQRRKATRKRMKAIPLTSASRAAIRAAGVCLQALPIRWTQRTHTALSCAAAESAG